MPNVLVVRLIFRHYERLPIGQMTPRAVRIKAGGNPVRYHRH